MTKDKDTTDASTILDKRDEGDLHISKLVEEEELNVARMLNKESFASLKRSSDKRIRGIQNAPTLTPCQIDESYHGSDYETTSDELMKTQIFGVEIITRKVIGIEKEYFDTIVLPEKAEFLRTVSRFNTPEGALKWHTETAKELEEAYRKHGE